MTSSPLSQLTIRSAVVRGTELGNILACDINKEQESIPHAYVFKWQAGEFVQSTANFDAHSICFISQPLPALVFISEPGEYGIHYRGGSLAGDLFEDSQPLTETVRIGGVRSLSEIGGKAYAVGYGGMVYRQDDLRKWTRIDEGLPDTFKIEAVDGFDGSDVYAVGLQGEVWHYNGTRWTKCELPTNRNLTMAKCTSEGTVYIAGHGGTMLRGRGESWEVIEHSGTKDDIWDLEWFQGQLYVSTPRAVYRLRNADLEPVDFGVDSPKTCYQLSSAKGVMWSNGEHDIMSFDGTGWTRVV